MPAKFVILAQPRTGSTLVCSLLNSVPGVRAVIEPINPSGHPHHMQPIVGTRRLIPELLVQTDLRAALDILFSVAPISSTISLREAPIAAGFKIMAHHILALDDEGCFWDYLSEFGVKVLVVARRNIVLQYVSDLITMHTNEPACWGWDPATAAVTVPIRTLETELDAILVEREYLFRNVKPLDHRILWYEDFKDNHAAVGEVAAWLFGQHCDLTTNLRKQNPDDLRSRVTNYDQLYAELRRLGLEHLA